MSAAKEEMEEIVAQRDSVKVKLGYLNKIQLVKQASGIIDEIKINLQKLDDRKNKEMRAGSSSGVRNLPKATSAEDLFNLIPAPSIEPVEVDQSPQIADI